jgi:murein DD-endopeptidase MepM/ murein hydrolase activator NlpD
VIVVVAVLLLLAAPAEASGSGGALAAPSARAFKVAPGSVAPGGELTLAFRATPGARARVDFLRPGQPAVRARLGRVGARGAVRSTWTADLEAGKYTARLAVTAVGETRYVRQPLLVVAPAPPPPSALTAVTPLFPVQGAYDLGLEAARFGAPRSGHSHQGHDILAAEGTPVVTPRAGTVHHVGYQAKGAGHYVVVAGDDARHYAFMHLQAGSIAVEEGAAVAAGQRLGAVGATGTADGPHLHFEIWVNGWWASKASAPVDPLPELLTWAASGA